MSLAALTPPTHSLMCKSTKNTLKCFCKTTVAWPWWANAFHGTPHLHQEYGPAQNHLHELHLFRCGKLNVRSPWLIGQLLNFWWFANSKLWWKRAGRMELIYNWFARFRSFWRWTSWIVSKVPPDIPSHLRPLLVHLHLCHLCLTQAYAWRVLQAMQFIGLLGRDCLIMTLLPILSAIPYGFHRENVPHLLKWHWRSSLCAEALGWFKSFCIVGCQPPSPFQPELSVRKEFGLRLGRSGEIWGDWSQVKMDIAWHCGAFVQYSEWMSKPVVAVHHGIRKKKSAGSLVQEPADWPWPACYLLIWLSMCPLQGLTLSYWRIYSYIHTWNGQCSNTSPQLNRICCMNSVKTVQIPSGRVDRTPASLASSYLARSCKPFSLAGFGQFLQG